MKRAGWKPLALGLDRTAAIAAAEARNAEVAAWRTGGATPRQVKRFVARATLGNLIARYRADFLPTKQPATRRVYKAPLDRLEAWGGDMIATAITRRNVRDLKDAMLHAKGPGHDVAHKTLKLLRQVYAWGIDRELLPLGFVNPAAAFGLGDPPPRDQIWDHADTAALVAAAHRRVPALPNMALAVALAEYTGQREADLLRLQSGQYREVMGLDPETQRALAGADGRVMGVYIRQGKTRRWVGVPLHGAMRDAIEAAIATNAARAVPTTTILVDDETGRPWAVRQFQRRFAELRENAALARENAGADPADVARLRDLQFRDFRRTAVVRLGELGLEDALVAAITGHMLATIKGILETYMPRTTKMAARAIVAGIGSGGRGEAKVSRG